MAEFRESYWYLVVVAILLISYFTGYGGNPGAKQTKLDRLPWRAKFAIVVATGAVVFSVALLLNT
jgi:hypothetical protein